MKRIANVEFTLEEVGAKSSYIELIKQAAKTPGQNGLGDLDEQILRMKIFSKAGAVLDKVKDGTKDEGKVAVLSLEDAEADCLVKCQANVKFAILDASLIAYQEMIKKLT